MTAETFLFYIFSGISLISGVMVIRSKNPVHSVLFLILVFCNAAGLLILLDLDFFAMIFLVVYVGAIAVLFLFVVMMLNIKLTEINENVLRYLPIGGLIGLIFLFEVLLVVDSDLVPVLNFTSSYKLDSSGLQISFSFFEILFYKIRGLYFYFGGSINGISTSYFEYLKDLENLTNISQSLVYAPVKDSLGVINTVSSTEFSIKDFAHFHDFFYTQWPLKVENITNIQALGQIMYTYYFYFFIMASIILLIAMIGAIILTMHKGVNVKRQEVYEQNNREFAKTLKKLRD
jgi:NADH:ubiquinone oxidoreductase subunit 6 (subunit J)